MSNGICTTNRFKDSHVSKNSSRTEKAAGRSPSELLNGARYRLVMFRSGRGFGRLGTSRDMHSSKVARRRLESRYMHLVRRSLFAGRYVVRQTRVKARRVLVALCDGGSRIDGFEGTVRSRICRINSAGRAMALALALVLTVLLFGLAWWFLEYSIVAMLGGLWL